MRCFPNILVSLIIASVSLALGCISELPRPASLDTAGDEVITPTPIVIVEYIDRATNASPELSFVPPTKTPTKTPTSIPALFPTVDPIPYVEILEIFAPEDGIIVRDNIIVVHGKAHPESNVTIDGANVVIDERGYFGTGVILKTGDNAINIVVNVDDQVKARATRHVKLLSRQPIFLSIREPLNRSLALTQNIPVSGLTTPDAKITVQGEEVGVEVEQMPDLPVKELGVFSTEVSLSVGTNHIQVVASNEVGQIIETDLVIAYLP